LTDMQFKVPPHNNQHNCG